MYKEMFIEIVNNMINDMEYNDKEGIIDFQKSAEEFIEFYFSVKKDIDYIVEHI